MLKFVLFCFAFMGIGGYAILRGKAAIRNRWMSNSLKSSLITGIKEIEGDTAVQMGKVSVIIGIVICSISGIVLLLGVGLWGVKSMLDRPPEEFTRSRDMSRQRMADANTIPDATRPRARDSAPATNEDRPERNRRSSRTRNSSPPRAENTREDSLAREDSSTREDLSDSRTEENDEFDSQEDMFAAAKKKAQDMRDEVEARQSRSFDRRGRAGLRGSNRSGVAADTPDRDRETEIEIGEPESPLPLVSFAKNKTRNSNLLGFDLHRDVTTEMAPEGAVLVGIVAFENDRGQQKIVGVQPMFQVDDQYALGKTIGVESGSGTLLQAPAGYVVNGMQATSGVAVTGLRLAFIKMDKRGKLLMDQTEFSDWIGKQDSDPDSITSETNVVVGATGGFNHHSGDLVAIGLVAATSIKLVESEKKTEEFESWKSANGKYTIEAKYVKHADGIVHLEKKNGKVIEVKISALGSDEQERITSRE